MTPYEMQNLVLGRFFKIWLNWKILEEIGNFHSKFGPKLGRMVYEWVTFSWKTAGLLSNSVAARPYQNQTEYPPPPDSYSQNQNEVLKMSSYHSWNRRICKISGASLVRYAASPTSV